MSLTGQGVGFTHTLNENKIGAVGLAAFGVGALFFLPETIAVSRYVFAAFLVMLIWRRRQLIRASWRRNVLIASGIGAVFLCLSGVETGAKIALFGSFLLVGVSMLRAMLLAENFGERAGVGAVGIAAGLLAAGILYRIDRLDLIECRLIFSAAAFAGALTLFLRPYKRRKP